MTDKPIPISEFMLSPMKSGPLTLKLFGQVRGGKNSVNITRTGRRYPNKNFEVWRTAMHRQIVAQLATWKPITVPTKATIRYWPGDLRRRDAPAIQDGLWHVLERIDPPIIKDDALLQSVDYKQMPLDRANPRCEITLEPII